MTYILQTNIYLHVISIFICAIILTWFYIEICQSCFNNFPKRLLTYIFEPHAFSTEETYLANASEFLKNLEEMWWLLWFINRSPRRHYHNYPYAIHIFKCSCVTYWRNFIVIDWVLLIFNQKSIRNKIETKCRLMGGINTWEIYGSDTGTTS